MKSKKLSEIIIKTFKTSGFVLSEPDVLLDSDYIIERSGEKFRSSMLTFDREDGKTMCLRPDLTVASCISFLQKKSSSKIYYSGQAYRRSGGKGTNFINDQLGIEILGSKNQMQDDFKVIGTILNSVKKIKRKKIQNKIGETLGKRGKEFGTVTARKRRCGWFDGVLVRQTIKISGINGIALTKLDVLDELDEIKMCVEYELNGKKINYLPAATEDQFNIKPIYKSFPGWKTNTQGIRNMIDLPENAKKYIYALEDFIGAKISSISTSPERDDTILIEDPFKSI